MNEPADIRRLIYFADPMCSWCWGFAPVMARLRADFGDQLPLRLVMGGLRAGNRAVMNRDQAREIESHWRHVREMTGQPFDFTFFQRTDFVYDTGPACRMVVAARLLAPGLAHDVLLRLHRAFYAEGADLTHGPTLLRLAVEVGLDEAGAAEAFGSEAVSQALADDFRQTLQNGVRAFPALLGGSEARGFMALTHGYQPFDKLKPALARLLSNEELPQGLMPGLPAEAWGAAWEAESTGPGCAIGREDEC